MDADGTACYILRQGQEDWFDAQDICLEKGDLGLARIQSDSQWKAAVDVMVGTGRDAYFGGNDIFAEGNWRYLDGTPVTYFRWKYKNSVQTGPKATAADSKDCMKLVKSAGWFDHNFCNRNSGSDSTDFLCERKPTCGSTGSITFGFGKK